VFLVQDQVVEEEFPEYEAIITVRNVGNYIPSPSYASLKEFKTCANVFYLRE
jgi:hypothetical protein